MDTMINLTDLLKHEILDLYSAEEQIIDALPSMIEKAKNPQLKKSLQEHLRITEEQKSRLDKIKENMSNGEETSEGGEKKGFFSRLFGGGNGKEKCKGMEGLITEGQKILSADITEEALDSAIIASAQKIEHYEICGYGTARAFARELKLAEVERLLTQTLNEEYQADDNLTKLAVGKLNIEAELATGMPEEGSRGSKGSKGSRGSKDSRGSKSASSNKTLKNTKTAKQSRSSSSKNSSSRRTLRTSTVKKTSSGKKNKRTVSRRK